MYRLSVPAGVLLLSILLSNRGLANAETAADRTVYTKRTTWEGMTWINVTRPDLSRVLSAHVPKKEGGIGIPMSEKQGDQKFISPATSQALLKVLKKGQEALEKQPRMDMKGGVAIPQTRDFGRVF